MTVRLTDAFNLSPLAAVRDAVHDDIDWNSSAPIDQLLGAENLISGFWLPLMHSFPDIKIRPYVFMGGIESGEAGTEWVSACGYLTGTFVNDWLGIPATGKKTNIWFGQFCRMQEGKIAASYVQYDVLSVARQDSRSRCQGRYPADGARRAGIAQELAHVTESVLASRLGQVRLMDEKAHMAVTHIIDAEALLTGEFGPGEEVAIVDSTRSRRNAVGDDGSRLMKQGQLAS